MIRLRWNVFACGCSLLFSVVSASIASAAPISLFVSPSGSDASGDGSAGAPFASVARAQAAVRAATANATLPLQADAVVSVASGAYVWPAPLRFGVADSGSGGFAVRYVGAGDGASVVYIGAQITGWQRVAPGSPVFVASVSGQGPPPPPLPPPPAAPAVPAAPAAPAPPPAWRPTPRPARAARRPW